MTEATSRLVRAGSKFAREVLVSKAHDTAVKSGAVRAAPAARRVLPLVALFALVAMLAVNLTQQHASAQSPPCTGTTFAADGTVTWCPQTDASSYIVLWWEPDSTDADLGLQHTTVSGQASDTHAIPDLTDGTTYETAVFTNDFAIVGSVAANSPSGGTSSDPVVSITADGDVVEGAAAAFTVNAIPPPTADLTVSVTVAATGDFGVTAGTQTVTIAAGATSVSLSIPTAGDDVNEPDGSVTATLDAPAADAGYTVSSTHGNGVVAVADDDTPEVSITADGDVTEGTAATFSVSASPAPTADLSVSVTVAATGDFGVTAGAQTVTIPTTGSVTLTVATTGDDVDEADGSVTATLDAPGADADYTVSSTQGSGLVAVADDDDTAAGSIDPNLIAEVQAHIDDFTARNHQNGVNAWTSVLKRLNNQPGGISDAKIASWLADSQQHGWQDGIATLPKVQAALAPPPVQPTPEVSISAGSGVDEGGAATFTVSANPAPTANLDVSLTVSESGSYISGTAPTSVTIPTSGSVTLTVQTTDDSADEADGSVTATLDTPAADAGYTVSSTQSAGTVAVADNDIPVVSISAGNNVTEGTAATFTVSASPTPHAALDVSVTVTESGSYISGTAPTSVTIPTGGTATLTVPTDNDTTDETDGSVTATLVDGAAYDLGTNKVATVNVADDDDAPQSTDNSVNRAEVIAEVKRRIADFTARNHQGGINDWTAVLKRLNGQPSGMTDAKIAKWLDNSKRHGWQDGIDTLPKVQAVLAASEEQPTQQPPTPEVNITASSGGTEGSNVTFTVTANPAPTSNLAVSVGIATSGDYGVSNGGRTVTIFSGTTSKTLTLHTINDSVDEPNGSVVATLVSGSGYTIGSLRSQTAQVTDDDDPPVQQQVITPVVSISGGNGVTEGGSASFTLTATPAPTSALSVSVTVSASGDYGATTGSRTVSIGTGGSATFSVATTNDSVDESDGSVTATVVDGSDYDLGTNKVATVTVSDNDDPPVVIPVVTISGGADVTEGGHAVFTLTATPAPTSSITVQVQTSSVGDYLPSTSTTSVQIGPTGSATHSVHTHGDDVDEADGSVTATLLDGDGYDLDPVKTATVAVSDDDDPPVVIPVVSISGGSGITEGGSASFTVTANPAPTSAITVTVKVSESGSYITGTAPTSVTIPTGGSATFNVATTNDGNDEVDGSVTVTLVDGSDYDLGTNKVAAVAVADNDVPDITITGGGAVTEGSEVSFTLTASPTPASAITVNVTISAVGDYGVTTTSQGVTIPAGSSNASFTVATTGDEVDEADGSVTATLASGTGYTGSSTATVGVTDDDDPPVGGLADCSGGDLPNVLVPNPSVSSTDTEVTFVVSLSCLPAEGTEVEAYYGLSRNGRFDGGGTLTLTRNDPSSDVSMGISGAETLGLDVMFAINSPTVGVGGKAIFTD